MQKKLIAAAIAGLIAVPALAQTNVTISGRFAAGYDNYKLSGCDTGPTLGSCDSESRFSDQSSRIIFNVTEDLGGGLSAWGQFDTRFGIDSAASGGYNGGNTGIGLMHKQWGKFTLGHWDVHYQEFTPMEASRAGSLQTLLGNGIMSQVSLGTFPAVLPGVGGNITMANGTRTSNLIMWDSPNWNGFTARLGYSTGWLAGSSEGSGYSAAGLGNPGGGDAWTATLRYNNGPWSAGYSYWTADSENEQTGGAYADQTSNRLWGSYAFAMGLKIGLAWDRSEQDLGIHGVGNVGNFKRTAWMVPINYAWGPHKVYFNYAKAGDSSDTSGVDTGAKAWSVGYDYAFSKRTSAGIFYTKLSNQEAASYNLFANGLSGTTVGGVAPTVGADVRQWYIGMAHNF